MTSGSKRLGSAGFRHLRHRLWLGLAQSAEVLLPVQRGFALRGKLYRFAGIQCHSSARICGRVRLNFHNVEVGADTFVGPDVRMFSNTHGRIRIGDRVDIAPGVTIHAGSHELGPAERRAGPGFGADIEIGAGCWVGVGAILLYGTKIGPGSVVAAGAVVKGVFPPNVVIAGVPGRVVRKIP